MTEEKFHEFLALQARFEDAQGSIHGRIYKIVADILSVRGTDDQHVYAEISNIQPENIRVIYLWDDDSTVAFDVIFPASYLWTENYKELEEKAEALRKREKEQADIAAKQEKEIKTYEEEYQTFLALKAKFYPNLELK